MCPRVAGAIRSAGPLVSTSLCGITSLFVTVSQLPRFSAIDWPALNGPPLTDHVWHPRIWWRMTTEALDVGAAEAAPAAITAARAAARTKVVCLSFIGVSLSGSSECGRKRARWRRVLAAVLLRNLRSHQLFGERP